MKELPDTLYIRQDEDGEDIYFIARKDLKDLAIADEHVTVGVYTLVHRGTITLKPKLILEAHGEA